MNNIYSTSLNVPQGQMRVRILCRHFQIRWSSLWKLTIRSLFLPELKYQMVLPASPFPQVYLLLFISQIQVYMLHLQNMQWNQNITSFSVGTIYPTLFQFIEEYLPRKNSFKIFALYPGFQHWLHICFASFLLNEWNCYYLDSLKEI